MKPASVTLSYLVYPPNYVPGDGYRTFGRMSNARCFALATPGSEIDRTVTKWNKRRGMTYHPHRKTKLGLIPDTWISPPFIAKGSSR